MINNEIVDLGLSVKWAKYNMGASELGETGDFFQLECLTSKGLKEGLFCTEISKWGKHWRLPTIQEYKELQDKCDSELVEIDGVSFERFISLNGEKLFFPSLELFSEEDPSQSVMKIANYWTSSRVKGSPHIFYNHFFRPDLQVLNGTRESEDSCFAFIRLVYDERFDTYNHITNSLPHMSNTLEAWPRMRQDASVDLESSPVKAIDLGLSVLWGSCNLEAEKETDFGGHFGWADPTGLHTESYGSVINTFERWKSSADHLYGGCNPQLSICNSNMDLASRKLGYKWRLPSRYEMDELFIKCKWEWVEVDGVNGYKVIGPNQNSIFLPAAGKRDATSISGENSRGRYWSGTLCEDQFHKCCAYALSFNKPQKLFGRALQTISPHKTFYRYYGFSMRPVKDK